MSLDILPAQTSPTIDTAFQNAVVFDLNNESFATNVANLTTQLATGRELHLVGIRNGDNKMLVQGFTRTAGKDYLQGCDIPVVMTSEAVDALLEDPKIAANSQVEQILKQTQFQLALTA